MNKKSLMISVIAVTVVIVVVFTSVLVIKKTTPKKEEETGTTSAVMAEVNNGKLYVNGVEVDPEDVGVDEENLEEYAESLNSGEAELPSTVIQYVYQQAATTKKASGGSSGNSTQAATQNTKDPVTAIIMQKTKKLAIRETGRITVVTTPLNSALAWSSSNPSVATVDYLGNVTGKSIGTATITAKAKVGTKTASCKVTVTEKSVTTTAPAVSTTKVPHQPVITDPATINAAVQAYNNAANKTKGTDKTVTIKKSVTGKANLLSCNIEAVTPYVQQFLDKNALNYSDTSAFTGGVTEEGIKLSNYLPVSGESYMSKLSASAVLTASVTSKSNGSKSVYIVLQPESATENEPAYNHASCMNVINTATYKSGVMKFTRINLVHHDATINATINADGYLDFVSLSVPYKTDGSAKIQSPLGGFVEAKFTGMRSESYYFEW